MREEFLRAMQAVDPAKPAPWEAYTAVIDSTARIENYAWMTPVPGLQQWQGHRRLGNINSIKYSIENIEYDASFEVLNRDVEDDQVGGYKLKPQDLARKAQLFPGRKVLQTLAAGTSTLCFDGQYFFDTDHAIGTGPATYPAEWSAYTPGGSQNDLTFTGSGAAQNQVLCLLVHSGPLKPLVWQTRKPPQFQTDAGTPAAIKAKKSAYWIDMEGAGGYGFWWDAIYVSITNTPTLTEVQALLGGLRTQFRKFSLPKAISSDTAERPHEQTEFSAATCTVVGSTGLENLVRVVLESETIVQSGAAVTNVYKGMAKQVTTAFLDP